MPASDQQRQHHEFISTPIPLFPSNLQRSILTISPEQIHLSTSTVLTLAWNIHDHVITSTDTIGIFLPGKYPWNDRWVFFCFSLDQLTVADVIENIYTNLNGLKIGQYHWHCTQTIINKLVNCTLFIHLRSTLNWSEYLFFSWYHSFTILQFNQWRNQSSVISDTINSW